MTIKRYFCLALLLLFVNQIWGQGKKREEELNKQSLTRILFIFDASNSMWGDWQSDKKINIANRVLSKMIDSLENIPNVELALRVYGHQKDFHLYDCTDTKLEVAFAPDNFQKIKQKLKSIYPRGTTPIGLSLQAAEDDFPECLQCRNIIILITDGIEECKSDPCEISQALQRKGIILKPFIIGIGANFSADLACAGAYVDASSENAFDNALTIIIQQIFNETTSQVNLLDNEGNPTETNVNMTFYDAANGKILYNYIHTLNTRGMPDTLYLDPMPEYDVKVHTLPPVKVEGIKLAPGKHTIIPVDAPQGNILVRLSSKNNRYQAIPILIRQADSHDILNIQYFNSPDKYIVGKYDLEALCLPRVLVKNVDVSQSYTTEVKIPNPGSVIIQKNDLGFGSLYVIRNGKEEWIYNLRDTDIQESILLQPGTYRIVFRKQKSYHTTETQDQTFIIKSDMTTTVNLQK
ncbi:MAG: VWA domain-containing protein [Bacteroidales bacterium]|jgi:Ca-activated chloride channel family protein|nr:VWA domain-containing protein [Bacteroidales bacterium]